MYNPSIFSHGFLKTEAKILGFNVVRVRNMELTMEMVTELVVEFTSNQTEMINEEIAETIMGQSWK